MDVESNLVVASRGLGFKVYACWVWRVRGVGIRVYLQSTVNPQSRQTSKIFSVVSVYLGPLCLGEGYSF